MNLVRYELKLGIVKGLVFGLRPYEFEGEQTYEVDHVVYLGIFQIILNNDLREGYNKAKQLYCFK